MISERIIKIPKEVIPNFNNKIKELNLTDNEILLLVRHLRKKGQEVLIQAIKDELASLTKNGGK